MSAPAHVKKIFLIGSFRVFNTLMYTVSFRGLREEHALLLSQIGFTQRLGFMGSGMFRR